MVACWSRTTRRTRNISAPDKPKRRLGSAGNKHLAGMTRRARPGMTREIWAVLILDDACRARCAEDFTLPQRLAELAAGDNQHCEVGSGSDTQLPDQRLGRRKGRRVRGRPSGNRIFWLG